MIKLNSQSNTLLNDKSGEKSQLKKIKLTGLTCQTRDLGQETRQPNKKQIQC